MVGKQLKMAVENQVCDYVGIVSCGGKKKNFRPRRPSWLINPRKTSCPCRHLMNPLTTGDSKQVLAALAVGDVFVRPVNW